MKREMWVLAVLLAAVIGGLLGYGLGVKAERSRNDIHIQVPGFEYRQR